MYILAFFGITVVTVCGNFNNNVPDKCKQTQSYFFNEGEKAMK